MPPETIDEIPGLADRIGKAQRRESGALAEKGPKTMWDMPLVKRERVEDADSASGDSESSAVPSLPALSSQGCPRCAARDAKRAKRLQVARA